MKYFVIFCILLCAYLWFGLQVDNRLTQADKQAIASLGIDTICNDLHAYADEIQCIKAIQREVQSIKDMTCAGWADTIEPAEFIRRDYGCCFDRARFIEKAAQFYGFKTRHVFLIERHGALYFSNLLPLGQPSHATSEILTQQGWLGVDSNEPWLLQDNHQQPLSYAQIITKTELPDNSIPDYFDPSKLDVIYGLYSRHGFFFAPKLPGPEFVFHELLYNLD